MTQQVRSHSVPPLLQACQACGRLCWMGGRLCAPQSKLTCCSADLQPDICKWQTLLHEMAAEQALLAFSPRCLCELANAKHLL